MHLTKIKQFLKLRKKASSLHELEIKKDHYVRLTDNHTVFVWAHVHYNNEIIIQHCRIPHDTYENAVNTIHHLMEIINDEKKLLQFTGPWM